jgi:hypothetical protein
MGVFGDDLHNDWLVEPQVQADGKVETCEGNLQWDSLDAGASPVGMGANVRRFETDGSRRSH